MIMSITFNMKQTIQQMLLHLTELFNLIGAIIHNVISEIDKI